MLPDNFAEWQVVYYQYNKWPVLDCFDLLLNKEPNSSVSRLSQATMTVQPINFDSTSSAFRFATAVAEIGVLLRNSDFKQAIETSRAAK